MPCLTAARAAEVRLNAAAKGPDDVALVDTASVVTDNLVQHETNDMPTPSDLSWSTEAAPAAASGATLEAELQERNQQAALERSRKEADEARAARRQEQDDPANNFVPEPPAAQPPRPVEPTPFVTCLCVAMIVLVTLACQQKIVLPWQLAYLPAHAPFDPWRPLSCFFFFSEDFSFNLLLSLGVTLQYVSRLELGHFHGHRSDFVALLLYCMALLIAFTTLLWASGIGWWQATPVFLLGPQFLDTLMTVFCLKNPDVQMLIPMTDIAIPAYNYIWVHVLIGICLNYDSEAESTVGSFGFVLELELLGVATGFICHYYPLGAGSLPTCIRRWCGDDVPVSESEPPMGMRKLISFKGRASRSEYMGLIASVLAAGCAIVVVWDRPVFVVVVLEEQAPLGIRFEAASDSAPPFIVEISPGSQASEHQEIVEGLELLNIRSASSNYSVFERQTFNRTMEELRTLASSEQPVVLTFATPKLHLMSTVIALICSGMAAAVLVLCATVRRLHDTGRSGWHLLWSCVPVVGNLMLVAWLLSGSDASPTNDATAEMQREAAAKQAASDAENAALRKELGRVNAENAAWQAMAAKREAAQPEQIEVVD